MTRRAWSLAAIAGCVVAVDQWTKSWATRSLSSRPRHVVGPVYLVLTSNRGAAFSLGSGIEPVIVAAAILLAVVVVLVSGRLVSGRLAKGGSSWASIVGLGLLTGGAVSNLADRFFRHHHGGVVDFIQLVSWWPIFNVADASITIGAVVIAVSLALPSGSRPPRPPFAGSPGTQDRERGEYPDQP
jgi:signal peptidase II